MDQLTAYRILGLENGSSPEEIREAYATLSKQYHPEEEPEKFQEIHEAYVTLTRRKRRGSVENVYREEMREPEETQSQLDFDKIEAQRVLNEEPKYDFVDAMVKAEYQTQEKLHELVLEAAAELKVLTSPKYKSNLKAYRAFFEDKKYELIIRKAEFLEKLCDVLEETKLQKSIYNYIIEFYRLRGMNPSELSPIGLRLYQVLDEKGGMKKVNPGIYGGIVAAIIAGFRALRPIVRESQIVGTIAFLIITIVLLVWIYKKIREKRSGLLAQAVLAIGIALSQFIVLMFDMYGTVFGTVDAGNNVASIIFLLACAWFFVVIIVASIKAIVGVIFRK